MRERFERDGFAVLDATGCAPSVLDGVVADLAGEYGGDGHSSGGVTYYERRIQDAWRISANVRALALSPAICSVLAELYGRAPLPFQTLNFRKGSEQAVHSDAIHFNSEPPGFMCGVWIALEDIDMDNGPLVYYPGSHRLPEITMQDVGLDPSYDDYPKYERFIAELVEREGLAPAYGTIRKGQAIVWAANLLHGGLAQRDPARTRHSQVTHYFFEGCRYYTPMTSSGGRVEWRDPTWVSDEAATRETPPYSARRIVEAIAAAVPENATVLVVTKGDDELLRVDRRRALHFPAEEPWNHPATGDEAVAALEAERSEGATHLVIPMVSGWWLEHYGELAAYLETGAREVARDDYCVIFRL